MSSSSRVRVRVLQFEFELEFQLAVFTAKFHWLTKQPHRSNMADNDREVKELTTTTTTIYLYPRMMGKLQFTFYISRGYSLPKITIGAKKNGQTLCYIEY